MSSSARAPLTLGRRRHAPAVQLVVVTLALAMLTAVLGSSAAAYWSATSAPGGHGAAAAGTVGRGTQPVVSADADSVTVTWPATQLSTGSPADGYVLTRYDAATLAAQPVGGSCGGLVDTSPCTELAVPAGAWVYTVTPRVGANWSGPESLPSETVIVDPPAEAVNFSVLGGTGVTSTGSTTVAGDLGVSPSASVVGFPPGIVAGTVYAGDATAAQGQTELTTAYDDAAGRTPHTQFSGDLNGRTFHPGVHHTGAALALTGTLTLDADNDPNAVFIFQVDAALNTAAASHVTLVDGARAGNVYWQVVGAAGIGANATFVGTILAMGAITIGDSSVLFGRAWSKATVTLANNTIRFTTANPPSVSITGGPSAVTKDPTPTLAGTTNAPAGSRITVRVAGQTLTTTALADGTWSLTATSLAAGVYQVIATVRDANGNAGTATQTLTVEINPGPVELRTATTYSVLAGLAVTSTGLTTLAGDLGVSPSTGVVGFPPGIVEGTVHAGDPAAAQALADLDLAYDDADGRTPHTEFAGDLNGRTFHTGVHHTAAALELTGTVTLDAEHDPDAVFIFQVDAALNTAALSQVVLVNGAQASNVYWQVLGAAGIGANAVFAGTILASGAITVGQDARLVGRALSFDSVTLATNAITFAP